MLNKSNSNCCGCTVCETICPQKAIKMEENIKGFLMPIIDEISCTKCGLCEKVCQLYSHENLSQQSEKMVLGIKRKKFRELSQSGGAFSAIAENFIKLKGIVYGVACVEGGAAYQRVDSIEDLKKLRGSKYVQATIGDVHKQVLNDLVKHNKVLFSGTPCYVEGLKKLVKTKKIDDSNLYTCDLFCHGVPSPKVLRDYVELIKEKYGNISEFNYRNKRLAGWHGQVVSFHTKRKRVASNNYTNIYCSDLELRESCYECKYACVDRVGDISVGDFWGIEKIQPQFDDNKGISVVIIGTVKGKKMWEMCESECEYIVSNLEECIQPNLLHPTEKPKMYDEFWAEYLSKGLLYAASKYCGFNWKKDVSATGYTLKRYAGSLKRRIMHR